MIYNNKITKISGNNKNPQKFQKEIAIVFD